MNVKFSVLFDLKLYEIVERSSFMSNDDLHAGSHVENATKGYSCISEIPFHWCTGES